MPMRHVLVWLSLATPLCAAVPGVPAPPRPGPFPALVLAAGNDALGGEIGDNADDFRTNEFIVQALIDRHWLIDLDHSILTNRETAASRAGRSDEATATLSYLWEPIAAPERGNRLWLVGGIGARDDGNLGGASMQDALHDALHYNRYHLAYEEREFDGVAEASLGWLWLDHLPLELPALPFLARGQIGVQAVASGLATTGDEQQAELGLDIVAQGVDGSGWIGPRHRWDVGSPPNAAAEAVARREAGWWLDYGASAGAWFVSGAINLDDRTTLGEVGVILGRGPGRFALPAPAQLEADLSFSGGYTPGIQFRWQPLWLRDAGWIGERTAVLVDYRFGSVDGADWGKDSLLSFRQALIGAELAWARPQPGWRFTPFVRAAVGARSEFVQVRGPDPRFDDSVTRPVLLGGVGARLTWGPELGPQRTVRYGVAAFADGWLPVGSAVARRADDGAHFQQPGWSPGGALTALIAW